LVIIIIIIIILLLFYFLKIFYFYFILFPNSRYLAIHSKPNTRHSDDILSLCFIRPNLLLASSDDGAFICWNVDSGIERFSFRRNKEDVLKKKMMTRIMEGEMDKHGGGRGGGGGGEDVAKEGGGSESGRESIYFYF
jgi:hypothetical protein